LRRLNLGLVYQIAEPGRENYAVFRKGPCRLQGMEAGRLAQNVLPTKFWDLLKS